MDRQRSGRVSDHNPKRGTHHTAGSIGMVQAAIACPGRCAGEGSGTQEIATLAGEMTAALTFGASIFTQTYDGAYNVNVGATIAAPSRDRDRTFPERSSP
jgi:hypothetical protein